MKTEASFSVEAAFVMPFVFWIIVFVIQTGLFMCDCCIAEAFLYERLTGKETFRKEFFVSECRVSDVQNEYPEKQVEAILKIKSPLFKFVDERKISICLVEDTPVKNAHSARAVRKIIKNLYTIVGEQNMTDITVKYDISMSEGFITIEKDDKAEVPDYVENMLLNNDICGFLHFGIKEIDNKKSFVYDISSKTSLEKICGRKKLTSGMIRGLMDGIFGVLEECDRYLLSEEDIILKPEYIFFEDEEKLCDMAVCYYPGYGEKIKDRLNELLGELINHLDYRDKEAVTLLYELYSKTGEEDCNVDSLIKILGENRKEMESVLQKVEEKIPEQMSVEEIKKAEPSEVSERNGLLGKIRSFFVHTEADEKNLSKVTLRERTVLLSDFSLFRKYKLVNQDRSESIFMDKTPFYIGKKENSMDLVINEDTVSRIHAKFTLEKSGCYLEDLNSTNGTFINGNRLQEGVRKKLEAGDIIAFAERKYVFELATFI